MSDGSHAPEPSLSVVIPAYNAEAWIEVMLASLDHQVGAPPFEVVVADNGSTDGTAGRVRAWSVDHPYVRLIDASGVQGASHARNEGIRAAVTDRILMCDADDVVSREWVRSMGEALQEHPYVGGPTVNWPFKVDPTPQSLADDLGALGATTGVAESASIQGVAFAPGCNCGIQRDLMVEIGGWDESLRTHEDPELALRLARRGSGVHMVEDAPVYYRQRVRAWSYFTTHVRYARPRAAIVAQYADLGLQGSVKQATVDAFVTAIDVRQWIAASRRPGQAARLGENVGFVLGWLSARTTRPRLPVTPLSGASARPPAVVFVVDQLIRPNGILSSVEILAHHFEAAGVPVVIVHEGDPDPVLADEFRTFNQKPGWRLTTEMPGFRSSRPLLKPARRFFTTAIWRRWTHRRNDRFLSALPPRTLIIGAGLDGTAFLLDGDTRGHTVVAQMHMSSAAVSDDTLELARSICQWVPAMTALTDDDARDFMGQGIAPCVPMPNPTTLPESVPDRREHLVVFIGRLAAEKQVDQLIRAFAETSPPSWRLEIYGQGPEASRLRALAEQVDADVALAGTTADVASVLRLAAINVLPSRAEGLPMSILEAAAHAVPTIAYDCAPGVRLAVGSGGVLLPVGDTEGLASALGMLMNNEGRRETLALAARDHVQRFSGARIAEDWIGLWTSLTNAANETRCDEVG